MLTHSQIWAAIDKVAENQGLSPSGLARRAGLDATTFNRSKRQTADGHLRWPSTESIAKVLTATGVEIDDFLRLVSRSEPMVRRLPFCCLDKTMGKRFRADGHLEFAEWDEIAFPAPVERNLYALEVRGNSYEPFYREGNILIVAPDVQSRRGDRVVMLDRAGIFSIVVLGHQVASQVQCNTFNGVALAPRSMSDLCFIHRIAWVSQ